MRRRGDKERGRRRAISAFRVPHSALRNKRAFRNKRGFSLLELMIAMFIMIILLSVAVPTYQRSVQHAKETVLKENIWQIRRAIEQYRADKGKLAKSVDDLVTAKYLYEKPIDPIADKTEWKEIMGDDPSSSEAEQGLTNVESLAEGEDSNGQSYSKH